MIRTVDGMKINDFAYFVFKDAFEKGLITPIMLFSLQSKSYSEKVFNSKNIILNEILEKDRHNYKNIMTLKEKNYLFSNWEDEQWDSLILWLRSINYNRN